ncbi:sulfatase-like hydrolase/transferase [Salinispira pacifica]|uniref:Putative membrane protein n=1 Tax=Salinispira pacifica TaxID=1307761 RepID=V5WMB2_9SPIO|nr:sulfatase-like hydrolase/transferase [Salinispira pacifica]AHC16770.1 putative membrane protein [Salinispira pacifica]
MHEKYPERSPANFRILRVTAAMLVLHLLLSAHYLAVGSPSPSWRILIPSGPLLMAFACTIAVSRTGSGTPGRRLLRYILTISAAAGYGLSILNSSGQWFFTLFYREDFSVIHDAVLIPGLFSMLLGEPAMDGDMLSLLSWAVVGTVLFLLGILLTVLLLRIGRSRRGRENQAETGWKGGVLVPAIFFLMAVIGFFIFPETRVLAGSESGSGSTYVRPVSNTAVQVAENYAFPGISDKDIHLLVIESYGSTLFLKDEYLDAMESSYRRLGMMLGDLGFKVYSGFVRSPVFGGRSWLADSSLLTATQISSQRMFDDRVASEQPAFFLQLLENGGYHRVYAAPGTYESWESWRKTFPFEEYFFRYDFGYEGPFVSFGAMPDQYFLDVIGRRLQTDRKEFIMALLVSSHVPFESVPPYFQEWSFDQYGREYTEENISIYDNNWLSGNELAEGYLASIDYSLQSALGYLAQHASDSGLMIVVGDHQPRKPVSTPDAGYTVPVHVILPANSSVRLPEEWGLSRGLHPGVPSANEVLYPEIAAIPRLMDRILHWRPEMELILP